MSKTQIPETSLAAFRSLKSDELRETYNNIISALYVIKEGTSEDVAKIMKCSPGKVWRRFSELHEKYKLIHRPGNKKPLKSGRMGFTWKLNPDVEPLVSAVDKILPGKPIQDFSRALNQPKLSNHNTERLF